MKTPLIGLTTYGRYEITYRSTHYSEWFAIPAQYVDAVRRAGGAPILLPPGEDKLDAILDVVDAVIVIGGGDIDPKQYGGNSKHPKLHGVDRERDASELTLVKTLASEKRLPTLCICRGMQVANVALGGNLFEHIPDVVDIDIHRGADKGWTVQPARAYPESMLAEIMGATDVATYSGHHQALKELGEGLRVAAAASDGMIEAVENPAHPWFICVQWHPEVSAAEDPTQQRIFDALVQFAAKHKATAKKKKWACSDASPHLSMQTPQNHKVEVAESH